MSKNNGISIFFVVFTLLAIAACTRPVPVKEPEAQQPVEVESADVESSRVKQADENFLKGEELLEEGDFEQAQLYFDRAIDILLEPGSQSGHSMLGVVHREQLDSYIRRISGIELGYLKDIASGDSEDRQAFLDEALATPLFKPTTREIKRMREKLRQEKPRYTVPVTVNSRVVSYINAFKTTRKQNIGNALNRSDQYIDEFKRIFKSYDLPEDLAYLPIIESGFRVHAVSRARARGVWQFIGSTARQFGLRVDWVVDERRDPFKSAHAAAKYLKQLYGQYGDWYLALACYNGGPRRLNRAIRRLKTKDFFKIARSRWYIRRETRNYVPAFLAALIIAKDPKAHGFDIRPEARLFENTKTIRIPSPVSLKDVAKKANVSYNELQKINPELIREFTPFNKDQYTIRVPSSVDPIILAQLKRLPPAERYFVGWYKVRRGDSLYSIARKFNTSVRKIKRANKLRSNLIRPGKRLLIPRG